MLDVDHKSAEERLKDAEWVLHNSGFRRCDIPACNCGSWHQVGGFKARFDEIKDVVEEAGYSTNGRTLLDAVKLMAAHPGRETVADWMMLRGYATGHGDTVQSLLFEMEGQLGGPKELPAGKGDIDLAIQKGLSKFGLSMAWEVKGAIADAMLEMLAPRSQ